MVVAPPPRAVDSAAGGTQVEPAARAALAAPPPSPGAPNGEPSRRDGEERPASSRRDAPAATRADEATPRGVTPEAQPALAAGNAAPARSAMTAARVAPESAPPAPALAPDAEPTARPAADRVTVHFEGEGGLEGRLRVALRGQSLHATIVSPDRETAQRLRSELGELHRGLAERGFPDARIAIHEARPRDGAGAAADPRNDEPWRDESQPSRRHDDPRDSAGDRMRRRPRERKPER
jgi:hypothetical protein